MCTVTVIPQGTAIQGSKPPSMLRVCCNRDESHARPAALHPSVRTLGPRQVLMPIDPVGGGTWIAANDAGVVLVLINRNESRAEASSWRAPHPAHPTPDAVSATLSRGTIIPRLVTCTTLDMLEEAASRLDAAQWQPCRLLAFTLAGGLELRLQAGERAFSVGRRWLASEPQMFTSSGLGDALVEGPRRQCFVSWMEEPTSLTAGRQDAFHRQPQPGPSELSVFMSRPDARTVSVTTVEWDASMLRMGYTPIARSTRSVAAPRPGVSTSPTVGDTAAIGDTTWVTLPLCPWPPVPTWPCDVGGCV